VKSLPRDRGRAVVIRRAVGNYRAIVSCRQLFWDLGEGPYNAQILQRPSPPGGALFKLKHFQRYEKLPQYYEAILQSWDPAIVDTDWELA
jgi:hypothetical protein